MNFRMLTCAAVIILVPALAVPVRLAAQAKTQAPPRYTLVDLGTLGGPSSGFSEIVETVNSGGTIVGGADTSVADAFTPNCFGPNCLIQHAFKWKDGVMTDLGALPGGGSSYALWINKSGQIAGYSQNGAIDPLTGGPEVRAVLWKKNVKIVDLGTLGGNQSGAIAINDRGVVVGWALNAIPDPFSIDGLATQQRAFRWDHGKMHDLGTLGGPDSFATSVNERGQIAGFALTNSIPNPGTDYPTIHPFLWDHGTMQDLGSLGGTSGFPNALNNRGLVVGLMTLEGDETMHPFLWDQGTLTDLGTLGGSNGQAFWLNDNGEVVGVADLPNQLHNAFLWKNGTMTDLGNLGRSSTAYGINSKSQVVGASRIDAETIHAFLWEDGGPMVDLNTLVAADSGLQLFAAYFINDNGVIAGVGVPSGVPLSDVESRGHAFLLIPVDQNTSESIGAAAQSTATGSLMTSLRARRALTRRIPILDAMRLE